MKFPEHGDGNALSMADRSGSPFAHPVDGQDSGVIERGREKGAGCVGKMMFGKDQPEMC
jgi:hypothetical protein